MGFMEIRIDDWWVMVKRNRAQFGRLPPFLSGKLYKVNSETVIIAKVFVGGNLVEREMLTWW